MIAADESRTQTTEVNARLHTRGLKRFWLAIASPLWRGSASALDLDLSMKDLHHMAWGQSQGAPLGSAGCRHELVCTEGEKSYLNVNSVMSATVEPTFFQIFLLPSGLSPCSIRPSSLNVSIASGNFPFSAR
jgi:hypothetical protein